MPSREQIRLALVNARRAGDRLATAKLEKALEPFAMAQPPDVPLARMVPQPAPELPPVAQMQPLDQARMVESGFPLDPESQAIAEAYAAAPRVPQTVAALGRGFYETNIKPFLSPVETAKGLVAAGGEFIRDPLGTGQAMVQAEGERIQQAGQSPEAAAEYYGSLISPFSLMRRAPPQKEIIIGERSKLFNKRLADKAKDLEKTGATRDQIWLRTGSYRGADGKWRQEISDEAFKLKNEFGRKVPTLFDRILSRKTKPGSQEGMADKVVMAEMLFKAYPELKDYAVKIMPITEKQAKANRGRYAIGLYYPTEKKILAIDFAESGALDTLIHEFQHAVQQIEGFSPGVNPKTLQAKYNLSPQAAQDLYWITAGEVEARMAAKRRTLTEQQRRQIPPYKQGEYGIDVKESRVRPR